MKLKISILFFSIFNSTLFALSLSQIEVPQVSKIDEIKDIENFQPSIIKNIDVSWTQALTKKEDDSYKIKVNFEDIYNFKTRSDGFKAFGKYSNKFHDLYNSQIIESFFSEIVQSKINLELIKLAESRLKNLDGSIKIFKNSQSSLIQLVKLEDERQLVLRQFETIKHSNKLLRDSFLEKYKIDLPILKFDIFTSVDKIASLMKTMNLQSSQLLSIEVLRQQLVTSNYEKDIQVNADNAILSHLEYERKIDSSKSDKNAATDHSLSIGISLPFFRDETSKLLKVSSYIEKKIKIIREIKLLEDEFSEMSNNLPQKIKIFKSKNGKLLKSLSTVKAQAVKSLSIDDYLSTLELEFSEKEMNTELLKEIYLDFLMLARESGEILKHKNILSLK